jgi:hypothetical protein
MPVIKVWCLPQMEEAKLNELHQTIVAAVVGVEELGLKDENDMTCLFPPDMMKYGLGSEIIVEVTGLFEKPERTASVHERLAWHLGMAVQRLYPKATIECFIYPFNPAQGFWRGEGLKPEGV